jgi:hypothetical protein
MAGKLSAVSIPRQALFQKCPSSLQAIFGERTYDLLAVLELDTGMERGGFEGYPHTLLRQLYGKRRVELDLRGLGASDFEQFLRGHDTGE